MNNIKIKSIKKLIITLLMIFIIESPSFSDNEYMIYYTGSMQISGIYYQEDYSLNSSTGDNI